MLPAHPDEGFVTPSTPYHVFLPFVQPFYFQYHCLGVLHVATPSTVSFPLDVFEARLVIVGSDVSVNHVVFVEAFHA